MSRFKSCITSLSERGYRFTSHTKLSGGINSSVYKVTDQGGESYVLKLYQMPSEEDKRERASTEKLFLEYLQFCNTMNVPKLIQISEKHGWALLTWAQGEKICKISYKDLAEISGFIKSINKPSMQAKKLRLKPASDSCLSLEILISSIRSHFERLLTSPVTFKTNYDAQKWLKQKLYPKLLELRAKLVSERANKKHWLMSRSTLIASPSDIGVHNMLRTSKGLYYFDFEYAGLDDLSKLACDLILHPKYSFDQRKEDYFLDLISMDMSEIIDESWIFRYHDIKPLMAIKWCLIMLNQLSKGKLSQAQLHQVCCFSENRGLT